MDLQNGSMLLPPMKNSAMNLFQPGAQNRAQTDQSHFDEKSRQIKIILTRFLVKLSAHFVIFNLVKITKTVKTPGKTTPHFDENSRQNQIRDD